MTLGERIKERRKQLGYSQYDLSKLTGISHMQISRYELSVNQPTSDVIVTLAKALNVSTDWLLGVTDEGLDIGGLSDLERQAVSILRTKTPDRQPIILEILRLA